MGGLYDSPLMYILSLVIEVRLPCRLASFITGYNACLRSTIFAGNCSWITKGERRSRKELSQNHTTLVVVDESCYYRTCSISTHSPEPVHITGEKKRLAPTANTMDCDKIDRLNETVLDLQCRSMKNNLIFAGLTHSPGENCEGERRSREELSKTILRWW
jgi:hypothetical protein